MDPGHPIATGLGESFVIEHEEMYGEHFDIPAPDRLVFVSWFAGRRGLPQRLLLPARPGPDLLLPARPRDLPDLPPSERPRVIANAARWAAAADAAPRPTFGNRQPLEHR